MFIKQTAFLKNGKSLKLQSVHPCAQPTHSEQFSLINDPWVWNPSHKTADFPVSYLSASALPKLWPQPVCLNNQKNNQWIFKWESGWSALCSHHCANVNWGIKLIKWLPAGMNMWLHLSFLQNWALNKNEKPNENQTHWFIAPGEQIFSWDCYSDVWLLCKTSKYTLRNISFAH